MPGRLTDKVALVTGGSSGIGREVATALAREGARVAVADISVAGGHEAVELIRQAGGTATFFEADVAQPADVGGLIAKVVATYGRLDCAHNNAGIEGQGAFTADYDIDAWNRVLTINLTGVWLCMKYEIPQMLKQGGGAIVNTSSDAGLLGFKGGAAYVASKHGVVGLTKTAALEYAKAGIRINAVCPGAIDTPMMSRITGDEPRYIERMVASEPAGRMGHPREVAAAVV
ncbi:short chain dehydrogenase [Candidatus Entotheonella serta]|nr:short chain dehydrogenase [Candidatus Entotheonella serta]